VVSAASDETYLRPNDYCQLVLARHDGTACREAPPPTRRPPVATGAADGRQDRPGIKSCVPGVMPAARMKASRLLAFADAKGLLLRIISRHNEQRQ
jgi:hypothetical protein